MRGKFEIADQEGRADHRHPDVADGCRGMAGAGHDLVAVAEAGRKLFHRAGKLGRGTRQCKWAGRLPSLNHDGASMTSCTFPRSLHLIFSLPLCRSDGGDVQMGDALLVFAWVSLLASLFLIADMIAADLAMRRVERNALHRSRPRDFDETGG